MNTEYKGRKLNNFEKCFINRESHSTKVIERAERLLSFIDNKPGDRGFEPRVIY